MHFDFKAFFQSVGIDFRLEGKNVKRGWVNINCPFCGDDRGFHMGTNPDSGGFACWRDRSHRSRSPVKLIKELKGCSWTEAKEIAGEEEIAPPRESLEDLEQQALALDAPPPKRGHRLLSLPPEFRKIREEDSTRRYWDYLRDRHFREDDIRDLCRDYRLRAATSGRFRKRVILPFLHPDGIIGWQGRTIINAPERYLSHPDSEAAKRMLFNLGPAWEGGKVLVIVEGPLDALKIDFYARRRKIRSVGTLGTSFVDAQVSLLFKLLPRYRGSVVLFDPAAEAQAMDLASRLSVFSPIVGAVPSHREDPGDLRPGEVVEAIESCF